MPEVTSTQGSARVHLIRGFALVLAASALLTGCAQKGPTSTSETVEGLSYGDSETTAPGTGGIDPYADPTTEPSTGATTSPGGSYGGQLVKFTVNGQDYSTVSPFSCVMSGDMVISTGGDPEGTGPSFSLMYTPGQEADMILTIYTDDFMGMGAAPGTTFQGSFDKSTSTFSISGTAADVIGTATAPIEISGTCV